MGGLRAYLTLGERVHRLVDHTFGDAHVNRSCDSRMLRPIDHKPIRIDDIGVILQLEARACRD